MRRCLRAMRSDAVRVRGGPFRPAIEGNRIGLHSEV